jgi:hypothetical protein
LASTGIRGGSEFRSRRQILGEDRGGERRGRAGRQFTAADETQYL